jgi:hypothetical protein
MVCFWCEKEKEDVVEDPRYTGPVCPECAEELDVMHQALTQTGWESIGV